MSVLTAYDKFIQQALKYGFSLWGTAKTGQTTKYRNGDDGDFEKGYPKDPPRFVDNGDGTITDNATGLIWVKEPGAIGGNFGTPGNPSTMTWDNAIDECLALNYAGHSDWRLPNKKELESIVDISRSNPAINPVFFPHTQNTFYKSSSTYAPLTTNAWHITFNDAETRDLAKTDLYYLRPVRLGIPKE